MIFVYSGWLVHEYHTSCLHFDPVNPKVCLVYDPFYADDLYFSESDVREWNSKYNPDMEYNDGLFDQDLLAKYIFHENESNIDISIRPRHLPQEGDGT
jgi:hypothetical protein